MATLLYLVAAVSVSCLLFAPVMETTTRFSGFSNTGLDSLFHTRKELFETTSRSVLDCGSQCVRDDWCMTFTSVKGSSSWICRGYNVTFNPTSAKGESATGPTTFSRPGDWWLNQTCASFDECPDLFAECYNGWCLCPTSSYFSLLQFKCVTDCAESDLQRTFLEYPGFYIPGTVTESVSLLSLDRCLEQCRRMPSCRTLVYDHSNSVCHVHTMNIMTLPWGALESDNFNYSLYKKNCA